MKSIEDMVRVVYRHTNSFALDLANSNQLTGRI